MRHMKHSPNKPVTLNGKDVQRMKFFLETIPSDDSIREVRSWASYAFTRSGLDFLHDPSLRVHEIVRQFQDRFQNVQLPEDPATVLSARNIAKLNAAKKEMKRKIA